MRIFGGKNNQLARVIPIEELKSLSDLSREHLLACMIQDLNTPDYSLLYDMFKKRFLGDFINLNFHDETIGRTPENILDKLFETDAFYLKKQSHLASNVNPRAHALGLITLPLSQLEIIPNPASDAEGDLAFILRKTDDPKIDPLYLSGRSPTNGEFRGKVLRSTFNSAKSNTPDMGFAELGYEYIVSQSMSQYLKLVIFTFFSMKYSELLVHENSKQQLMAIIESSNLMKNLLNELLCMAASYPKDSPEFDLNFSKILAVEMVREFSSTDCLLSHPGLTKLIELKIKPVSPSHALIMLEIINIKRHLASNKDVKLCVSLTSLNNRLNDFLIYSVFSFDIKLNEVEDLIAFHQSISPKLYEKSFIGKNQTEYEIREAFNKIRKTLTIADPVRPISDCDSLAPQL